MTDTLADKIEEIFTLIDDRFKKLEEKVDSFDECPNNKATIERIKRLEERTDSNWGWIESHVKRFSELDLRQDKLAQKTDRIDVMHSEVLTRLEEWQKKHESQAVGHIFTDDTNEILRRVKELEEKRDIKYDVWTHGRIEKVEDRVKDLESEKVRLNGYEDRVVHLEEWSEQLKKWDIPHANRVKALEDWKRAHMDITHLGDYTYRGSNIVINKEVWKEMRVLLINLPWEHYRKFEDLIKKVDSIHT